MNLHMPKCNIPFNMCTSSMYYFPIVLMVPTPPKISHNAFNPYPSSVFPHFHSFLYIRVGFFFKLPVTTVKLSFFVSRSDTPDSIAAFFTFHHIKIFFLHLQGNFPPDFPSPSGCLSGASLFSCRKGSPIYDFFLSFSSPFPVSPTPPPP